MATADRKHGWMMRAVLGIGVATALDAVAAADPPPRYREGQPPVMTAHEVAGADNAVGALRVAYAARGQPRVMLFWNRILTDQVTGVRKVRKVRSLRPGGPPAVECTDETGGDDTANAPVTPSGAVECTEETVVDQGRRRDLHETLAWTMEDAVVGALTDAGVRLVDRNAAIRFTAADGTSRDPVRVETAGLAERSDLLMELLMTPDARAPGGVRYRVLVKENGTGRLLASGVTGIRTHPEKPATRLKVGRNGFEREPVDADDAAHARELGRLAVTTLAGALR